MPEETHNHFCQNCGNILRGADKFCSECGQKRLEKEDFLVRKFLAKSFGDFFHFESKFTHSLIPLLFKPGYLTLEFMKGRRQRYFQPFKMFLFISVFYFILTGLDLGRFSNSVQNNKKQTGNSKNNIQFKFNYTNSDKISDSLNKIPADTLKKIIEDKGFEDVENLFKDVKKSNWLDRYMFRQEVKFRLYGKEKVLEELYHYIPKFIFLLIPLFALLLKLFYIRRKRKYFEHLVFSLHFHSFVFMLFILVEFFSLLINNIQIIYAPLIFIYLFVALKKFYGQRVLKTLTKNIFLLISYIIFIGFFFLFTTIITLEMM